MKLKNILSIILSTALFLACFNSLAFAEWKESDGKTYYETENGNKTGWLSFTDGTKYYFDEAGVLAKGWILTDEGRFFLDPTEKGNLSRSCAKKIGGVTYNFDENGNISDAYTDVLIHTGFSGLSSVSVEKLLSIGNVSDDDLSEFSLPSENSSENTIVNHCGISVVCYASDGIVGLTKIGGVPAYIAVYFDKNLVVINSDSSEENFSAILKKGKEFGTKKAYTTENEKLYFWNNEEDETVSAILNGNEKIIYQIEY